MLLRPVGFIPRSAFDSGSAGLGLSWIDPNGERKQYGTVLPGAVWIQQTFVGHAWVLTDADGKDVSAWMPGKRPGRAILRGAN